MKTITICTILHLALLANSQLMAQQEPRGGNGPRPDFEAMWKKHDTNADGFISLAEFQAMPRLSRLPEEKQRGLFQRLDKDGDGKLSREELRQMRQGPGGQRPMRGMRRLMELDANRDGGVSLEEFRAGGMFANVPVERVDALFKRLDTDGDGLITPKDRPELPPILRNPEPPGDPAHRRNPRPEQKPEAGVQNHRRLFARLDADQSGGLTFEEFRKAPGVVPKDEDAQENLFLRLDANGDHKLSHEEFSRLPLPEPPARSTRRPQAEGAEESAPRRQ